MDSVIQDFRMTATDRKTDGIQKLMASSVAKQAYRRMHKES